MVAQTNVRFLLRRKFVFVVVVYLEHEERQDDLDRERAAVDEVAVEEIRVRDGRQAVDREDIHQVVELAVHVAADGDVALLRRAARRLGRRRRLVDLTRSSS